MNPSIDIVVLTRNQASFILQCLDGISQQIYSGLIRVILINDASDDNTKSLIDSYSEKFPFEFFVIHNPLQYGINHNIKSLAAKIRSDYVAFVDGDDYWSYPYKLQSQIDFLEQNKQYVGCFHNTQIWHEPSLSSDLFRSKKSYNEIYAFPNEICLTEVLQRKIIPTSSLVLNSKALEKIPWKFIDDEFSNFWKLLCFVVNGSRLKYIDEVWSVYRNHHSGISKERSSHQFHWSHFIFLKKLLFQTQFKMFRFEILNQLIVEAELILSRSNSKLKKRLVATYYLKFTLMRLSYLLKSK